LQPGIPNPWITSSLGKFAVPNGKLAQFLRSCSASFVMVIVYGLWGRDLHRIPRLADLTARLDSGHTAQPVDDDRLLRTIVGAAFPAATLR
jgi:hypothetical protein